MDHELASNAIGILILVEGFIIIATNEEHGNVPTDGQEGDSEERNQAHLPKIIEADDDSCNNCGEISYDNRDVGGQKPAHLIHIKSVTSSHLPSVVLFSLVISYRHQCEFLEHFLPNIMSNLSIDLGQHIIL